MVSGKDAPAPAHTDFPAELQYRCMAACNFLYTSPLAPSPQGHRRKRTSWQKHTCLCMGFAAGLRPHESPHTRMRDACSYPSHVPALKCARKCVEKKNIGSANGAGGSRIASRASRRTDPRTRIPAHISLHASPHTHLPARISPHASPRTDIRARISPRALPRTHLPARISPHASPRTRMHAPPRTEIPAGTSLYASPHTYPPARTSLHASPRGTFPHASPRTHLLARTSL
ncbi:hypothetical protein K438DRAFT_1989704 [Mycena galopus ATCC 62051]|nr:hypothetical protein K438DRAFT_1989704 [Mycena galopus ATCC 62051]